VTVVSNASPLINLARIGELALLPPGLVGVLVEAKHKGLTSALRPQLDALRNLAGFWVSDRLYTRVLQDEGEMASK